MFVKISVPLGFIASLALYFAKLGYIFRAWKSSPLDRPDAWLFGFAALVAAAAFAMNRRGFGPGPRSFRLAALAAALGALAAFGVFTALGINALAIFAALGFSFFAFAAGFGVNAAIRIAPAYALLALAVPSTTYWIANYAGVSVFAARLVKGAATVGVMVAFFGLAKLPPVGERATRRILALAALAAAMLAAAFAVQRVFDRSAPADVEAYRPDFAPGTRGGYIGRAVEPDAAFRRFFATSDARQYVFANREGTVNVLEVRLGDDVHEVHPATHCLRSSGWSVRSEAAREETVGGRRIVVSEALVSRGETTALNWAWYSSETDATASFFRFRSRAKTGDWRIYQLRTAAPDGMENARARLRDFLESR